MNLTSSLLLFITYEEENIRESRFTLKNNKETWPNWLRTTLFSKIPCLKFPGWMFITMITDENAQNSFEVEKLFQNLK